MKKSRFSESQIVKALKEVESGRSVDEVARELGVAKATFYNWRRKYAGMDSSALQRLKELEQENARLKRMYADLALSNTMLKDVLEKKL